MDLAAYLNATYYDPRDYSSKLRLFEEATPALQSEIFNRKLSDEYRDWMEELRDQTFIERRGYFADAARFGKQSFGETEGQTSEFESGLEGYNVLRGTPEQAPAQ